MPLTRTSAQLACDSAPRGMPVPAKLQFVSKFATSFAADAASSFASATLTVCSVVRVFFFVLFSLLSLFNLVFSSPRIDPWKVQSISRKN